MKWKETVASKCRWSEYAAPMFADEYDIDIILDASTCDYQGQVELLASYSGGWYRAGDKEAYLYLEYSYGSCSGCDAWEGANPARVALDMAKCAMPLSRQAAIDLLEKRRADAWDDEKLAKYDAALKLLQASAGEASGG